MCNLSPREKTMHTKLLITNNYYDLGYNNSSVGQDAVLFGKTCSPYGVRCLPHPYYI